MWRMTSTSLRVPALRVRRGGVPGLLLATAVASGALAAALNGPILRTAPLFAWVNVATTACMVTFGVFLVRRQNERLTGWCFAFAGLSWQLGVLDVRVPTWGPLVQWVFSGITYTFLAWGILRYRRRALSSTASASSARLSS